MKNHLKVELLGSRVADLDCQVQEFTFEVHGSSFPQLLNYEEQLGRAQRGEGWINHPDLWLGGDPRGRRRGSGCVGHGNFNFTVSNRFNMLDWSIKKTRVDQMGPLVRWAVVVINK